MSTSLRAPSQFSLVEFALAPYRRYQRNFPPAFQEVDPNFPDRRWHQRIKNFILNTYRGYEPRRPWDKGTMFPNWNHVWRVDWLVALYHGYWLRKWTHTWQNQKIRVGVRSNGSLYCVKYARAPSRKHPSNEVHFLRMLSQPGMDDPRNHTAFAHEIFWFDKLVVTPWYHTAMRVSWRPNDVVELAVQYFEGLAFFHEHDIAHLDAGLHNIVFAIHPELDKPRYMFIDFELAEHCPNGRRVDLWWLDPENGQSVTFPPEGLYGVDPFAFDMLRSGYTFKDILENDFDKLPEVWPNVEWPDGFRELFDPMRHNDPSQRPAAQWASERLAQMSTTPIEHHTYVKRNDDWWKDQLKWWHPGQCVETPLPSRRTL